MTKSILVPRACDPSGLWQGSRALARPDFLSMRRVFVSYSQPIKFARFDGKSMNRGLPELSIPPTGQKERGLWGREYRMTKSYSNVKLTPINRNKSRRKRLSVLPTLTTFCGETLFQLLVVSQTIQIQLIYIGPFWKNSLINCASTVSSTNFQFSSILQY